MTTRIPKNNIYYSTKSVTHLATLLIMPTNQKQFEELSFYTLAHPDTEFFIHQLIVDAYTAQTATIDSKQISIVFALVGLYLFVERKFTGREIQKAHQQLSRFKKDFPPIILPFERGNITISDVLKTKSNKDEMIMKWSASVWSAYQCNTVVIKQFCDGFLT